MGALLLVTPTINTIIAGLVGLVALLGTAVVGAVAFAAAFTAVGVAMGFAAFKWRDLLASSYDGVSEWRGAILAIEAEAFNAFERHHRPPSRRYRREPGTSMWDSVVEGSVTLINKMRALLHQGSVTSSSTSSTPSAGVPGAFSPLVEFLRTWVEEWKVLQRDRQQGHPSWRPRLLREVRGAGQGVR